MPDQIVVDREALVERINLDGETAVAHIELFAEILDIPLPTREQDTQLFFIKLKSAVKEQNRQVKIAHLLRVALTQIQGFR